MTIELNVLNIIYIIATYIIVGICGYFIGFNKGTRYGEVNQRLMDSLEELIRQEKEHANTETDDGR